MSLFVLVGSKEPLYKMEMKSRKEESAHVDEFLLHSALDIVDEMMWTTQPMALKVVDKFNDQLVSAFVTATNVKFLLLHETRNDDTIKAFFHEVHELYLKVRPCVSVCVNGVMLLLLACVGDHEAQMSCS